jgi:predicted AlkP superfamily pyrophosphatase or phosphodiesterase
VGRHDRDPSRVKRIFLLFWCVTVLARAADRSAASESPLILISLDGYRWDYTALFPAESATLRALEKEGASVRALVPVFPSNTFPNHYSIVTGMYPAHHGIINNDFFDPTLGAVFKYNLPAVNGDPRWWGGEPIWVTAIKQGRKAAVSFWVGSEAEVKGVRPAHWRTYDPRLTFETRLEELVGWMKLPAIERPAFVAFYIEDVNANGHRYGPTSPEVVAAVRRCDERIATLLARLRGEGLEPNLVIVSDHGMTATAIDRVLLLDDYLDLSTVQVDAQGSAMALRPIRGDAAAILRAFRDVPHLKAHRVEDLPARFRLTGNDRISPVWLVPDEGWHIATKANFERLKRNYPEKGYVAGDHGYDPTLPTMHGILIAHGPAFRRGARHDAIENIHVYNLLCSILKLKPAPNDGDDRLARSLLRE